MKFILVGVIAVGFYIIVWPMVYFGIMGADKTYFWEYWRLSWAGPGEIPATIQFISLAISAIGALAAYLIWLRK